MTLLRKGRRFVALAAVAAGIAVTSCSAKAQNVNSGVSIGPSQSLSGTAPSPSPSDKFPKVEHLLGDWGGLRTSLDRLGINILLDYTSETAANVSGGARRDLAYADQRALEIDIDWQKLAGIQGFATHFVVANRAGSNASQGFGDNLLPVQEIYGAGGNVLIHLVYLYGEETLRNGDVDIAAGYFPVGTDFAASPINCNFMNLGLCGNPKGLPGGDLGFSAWPDATLGARVRGRPTADTYIQVGVFGVDPFLYGNVHDRTGFDIDPSQYNGVEVPVEAAWEPKFGPDALPGHYKLGFGYDSASYPSFLGGGAGAAGPSTNGRIQFWGLADQMFLRHGDGDKAELIGFAGYIRDDPRSSIYQDEVFAGLVDQGFWKARSLDTVGLLFIYQTVSSQLTSAEKLDREFDLPFSNSVTGVTATGVQMHEGILEVNYDIHAYRGINIEPDFQYVMHPNGQHNLPNAVVLGLKTHIEF